MCTFPSLLRMLQFRHQKLKAVSEKNKKNKKAVSGKKTNSTDVKEFFDNVKSSLQVPWKRKVLCRQDQSLSTMEGHWSTLTKAQQKHSEKRREVLAVLSQPGKTNEMNQRRCRNDSALDCQLSSNKSPQDLLRVREDSRLHNILHCDMAESKQQNCSQIGAHLLISLMWDQVQISAGTVQHTGMWKHLLPLY